eukprot:TRINITY_DN66837_c7_g1_i4.p1 TRINITY_DN66837_c7_g1~~TRINITY_DN66837_c7_g1_i4.p1  ORF type:complete len:240 (-),score=91.29 TRINITY_DN66837_c7_g1_i4:1259-1978(-)
MTKKKSLTLRPWSEFFESSRFSVPSMTDDEAYSQRLVTNLVYYQANYLLLACLCLLYVCIARPRFLVIVLLVAAAGVYLFRVRRAPVEVGGRLVPRYQVFAVYAGVAVVMLLVAGGMQAIAALGVSSLIVLAHSSLRKRSLKARGTSYIDRVTGSTPIGSAFKALDEYDSDGPNDDEENPAPAVRSEQAKFRSNFRAKMKAKYLKNRHGAAPMASAAPPPPPATAAATGYATNGHQHYY